MGVVMIYNPVTEQMEPAAAVISYGLASEDEIEAGVVDDKIVTPKGLAGALALKAPLASPTFTGDVVVPDQTAGNNSTKAANTKYVDAKVSDAIVNGVTGIAPSQNVVYDELLIKEQIDNLTYAGVDLTTKFATEIAGYADVWAWIKARITAVNYAGLNIGDYIPFSMPDETLPHLAQIAGIDTYYNSLRGVEGFSPVGHHIDFISKDLLRTNILWNNTNTNNGNADNAAPWMVSNIKAELNTTVYNALPAGLKSQIIEKALFIETRYSASGALTASTGTACNLIGKLWIPTEYEIFGDVQQGTVKYSGLGNRHYPLFSNSNNLAKRYRIGTNYFASSFPLLDVLDGSSSSVLILAPYAARSYIDAVSIYHRAPICFRIG